MDCVTCMLMGMCMLCTSDMSASEPGRPMTRAEVDEAVVRVVDHFREAAEKEERDRRQRELQEGRRNVYERHKSFLEDPRFSNIGIGKKSAVDALTVLDKPEEVSWPKNKKPQRFASEKLLLIYPSHGNTKLTIKRLLSPSTVDLDPSKNLHSKSDRIILKRLGVKRKIDRLGFPEGTGKEGHIHNSKFRTRPQNTSSSGALKLEDLIKRIFIGKSGGGGYYKIFYPRSTVRGGQKTMIRITPSKLLRRGKRLAKEDSKRPDVPGTRSKRSAIFGCTQPGALLPSKITGQARKGHSLQKSEKAVDNYSYGTTAEKTAHISSLPKLENEDRPQTTFSSSQINRVVSGFEDRLFGSQERFPSSKSTLLPLSKSLPVTLKIIPLDRKIPRRNVFPVFKRRLGNRRKFVRITKYLQSLWPKQKQAKV
ncbi:hypothetical protein ElyMa_004380800 [Elysia marginata]|uniref:Uncharacterized protein n=1 Tax=Elysia marginata TaxID=1093978 RepID=A0AAV4H5R0_9GAST|nr:hypothetical protein ElyMa_004380800 [Elysia marginata]